MFGGHIGILRVILQLDNGDEKVVWKMSGNKGDVWIAGNVTANTSRPYKVRNAYLFQGIY